MPLGITRSLRAAFTRALNRRSSARRGRIEAIPDSQSELLGNSRQVSVYLPPGYDERPARRYPVLYMQDGQNLFEDSRAFAGRSWRLGDALDESIGARTMRPVIVVGVDHAGVDRIHEYGHVRDESKDGGGRGDDYAAMLFGELKPRIDLRYRTAADDVALGGSSLGGLIALYMMLRRPGQVRRAAVMSPSVWWSGRAILGEVDAMPSAERPRVWLDIGGREGREALSDARLLRDRMSALGWTDATLKFYEDRRGDHSERAWGGRVRKMLEFLFPPE